MSTDLASIWVYLTTSPLTGLVATLLAYQGAHWLWRKSHMNPLLNPVMISVATIGSVLLLTGIEYRTYFDGAKFVHFLLGPATVALALPLYKQVRVLMSSVGAVAVALVAGSVTAILSAMGIAWALGGTDAIIRSLAPKSATAPIAMAMSDSIGGISSLTAALAVLTGITGSVIGPWLLDRLRVRDERARGLAIGTASHGIGTARALQMGETTGAFSGLAMGLNGIATAVLVPLLVRWVMG